ncbi:polyprenol phosphomannose-dependent alpha 1,6 mannosyltransferase MptB [Gordonia zhaorongruii]|uniref:polyprenol phosphomannose-dependent alpha 1,6 mannosyltransferase MptB n=1 Tax=Gordonia zhaorongruii TaxID=2597659 RepID=UPI001044BD9A|nr:polyprenol phosphomannose-dependent alpha 1,6 mannosyltransferase MptB [Gordonia zhaorongruii]
MSDVIRRYPNAVLGFIGSLGVMAGSYGLADVPRNDSTLADAGLAPMTYGHGKTLAGIAFWLGVALMVIAWVRIGRDHRAMTLRATSATALAWAAPLMFAVPTFSRDVYAYLGQATVLADGFDPYQDGPAHVPGPVLDSMAQIWAPTTSPYSPAFMLLARGVVGVTGENVFAGVMAFRVVLLPGLLLALWAVPRIAAHFGASRRLGVWLAVLNPMLLIHLVGGPHSELLLMGVLAAGIALALGRRHVWGLVVLGVAAALKVTAGVAVPFVLWIWLAHLRRDREVTARDRIGMFAATAAIPSAVFGAFTMILGLGFGWLNGLAFADRIINPFTVPTLLGHVFSYLLAPFHVWNLQEILGITRTIGSVVLTVLLVLFWWRGRHDERGAMRFMCFAMFAVLLLEPSTLPWYYSWLTVLVVAFTLPLWARQVIVGLSAYLLIVFQPDDSILFYNPLESALAVALGVLAAVSLRTPDPLRLRRFGSLVRGHA